MTERQQIKKCQLFKYVFERTEDIVLNNWPFQTEIPRRVACKLDFTKKIKRKKLKFIFKEDVKYSSSVYSNASTFSRERRQCVAKEFFWDVFDVVPDVVPPDLGPPFNVQPHDPH